MEVRLDVSEWVSGVYFVDGVDDKGMKRDGEFVKYVGFRFLWFP